MLFCCACEQTSGLQFCGLVVAKKQVGHAPIGKYSFSESFSIRFTFTQPKARSQEVDIYLLLNIKIDFPAKRPKSKKPTNNLIIFCF